MIKKTVSYEDFNGINRTEDLYFHLNEPELIALNKEYKGGLATLLEEIAATDDKMRMVEIIKVIVLKSYGIKSEDGKSFIKFVNGKRISEDFEQTQAYVEVYMELIGDGEKAADFVNGIVPASVRKKIEEEKNA